MLSGQRQSTSAAFPGFAAQEPRLENGSWAKDLVVFAKPGDL
jgi:hypothetical protein